MNSRAETLILNINHCDVFGWFPARDTDVHLMDTNGALPFAHGDTSDRNDKLATVEGIVWLRGPAQRAVTLGDCTPRDTAQEAPSRHVALTDRLARTIPQARLSKFNDARG
ncbi:hypothetical protein GGQ68_001138 [Sagittula marina]|uniref:Uncharacterized protein n=1 Tax=Sagittula marina TaxID=943940 RepID=A0A7W6DQ08_9RHOB|nr:hypothetical protein [Sagittula marina]MBB3984822.1 hypothetical protein [Sagittula marina]